MKKEEIINWLGEENTLGLDIWEKKYQHNGEEFEAWLDRVSNGDGKLKKAIKNKEFLFGGRILSNRGVQEDGRKITYSNCYVMTPPEDNIESIFDTAKKLARTFSYGGGCGIDISKLRPRGSEVNNSAKETTGSVSFMDLYNLTTEIIGQKGRRGALMLSIDANHPDVADFIKVKSDLDKVKKANISVRVGNDFMQNLKEGKTYSAPFTVEGTGQIIENIVNPKEIFKELAYQNWNYAEPGVLFWDNISKWNLLSEDEEFEYAGTNPCGEEPLPAGGSCLLGSLILPSFVTETTTGFPVFNFSKLGEAVEVAVKALNDVLDEGLPLHPLEEQRNSVGDWRQIGLGVLGVGDMLIKLRLKYDSEEALSFCKAVSAMIIDKAIASSAKLASKSGVYPKYKKEAVLRSPFLKANTSPETYKLVEKYGLRNSQLLTIAPTGSIGTMLQTSTGVEPNFAFSYTRKTESLHGEDVFYTVFTPIAEKYMEKNGLKNEKELPPYFVSAQNINPEMRVKMQGVWQNAIDASISSTVNLVNSATVEDVENVYKLAWENGLKGMTVYRAGCAREGILTIGEKEEEKKKELLRGAIAPISSDTIYYPEKIKIGCGKLKLMIGYSEKQDSIQDIYVIRSGQGGCEKNLQAVVIYMSGMLRLGGDLFMLEKAVEGISGCTSFSSKRAKGIEVSPGTTCSSAILNALKSFENNKNKKKGRISLFPSDEAGAEYGSEKSIAPTFSSHKKNVICPECGAELLPEGGCYSCRTCGYSKCD